MIDLARWPVNVARALAAPAGRVAFDMDGTLIDTDIGEVILRRRIAAGDALPGLRALLGSDDVLAAYEAALEGPEPERHYLACALGNEGESVAGLHVRVAGLFAEGVVGPRAGLVALAKAFVAAGHEVWIVTGTLGAVAEAVAAQLGLQVSGVLGHRLRLVDGRVTGETLGPVMCGDGKVVAWRSRHADPPLMVFGDTVNDLPLMEMAILGSVAVPVAAGEMADQATLRGIPVVIGIE